MRRFIAFIVVFVLILGSIPSLAAPGDIIHTGLKKIYRGDADEFEDLIDDIVKGADLGLFYRETDHGKYVNIVDEEKAQLKYLRDLVEDEGISSQEELEAYMSTNSDQIEEDFEGITGDLAEDFGDIVGGDIEDYSYSSAPLRLGTANYSTPDKGAAAGTTKISILNLPSGAYKWQYIIAEDQRDIGTIKRGNILVDGTDYIKGQDIPISPEEFIDLYALDRNNRIIGFASIEVHADMIRKPTVYADELGDSHYTGPEFGDVDGSTKFSSLDFIDIEADKWYVHLSKLSIPRPELDSSPLGSEYIEDTSIGASSGDRLLLSAVEDNKVKAYKIFTLTAEQIRPITPIDENKAIPLIQGTHFTPPVKGTDVGQMKFATLNKGNLEGTIVWRYAVSDKVIPVPDLDSTIEDIEVLEFNDKEATVTDEEEIFAKGTVNKNFILLATVGDGDDYEIKAYAMLKANETNVRLPIVKKTWGDLFSDPIKGTSPFSTKVEELDSEGILGFNHWRYKLVKGDVEDIEFNTPFANSNYYTPNTNIPSAAVGDNLVIAATDSSSRVKIYGVFELVDGMVRGENASLLVLGSNYFLGEPKAGTHEGSTSFTNLSFSSNILGASKWMVAIGSSSFGDIEKDTEVEDSEFYNVNSDIEDVKINDYLLLLATDVDGKVKGYREFRLNEGNIRGGKAVELKVGTGTGENYTVERGVEPGTTRFANLKFDGLYGATNWRYKLFDEEPIEEPYFNQVVDGATFYNVYNGVGANIKVSLISEDNYGYVLLLATDGAGKTKGYDVVEINGDLVKEHAPELSGISLEKGATADKVDFDGIDGAKSYKYILDTREYPTPAKDDVLVGGTEYGGEFVVRIGQHLTLFEIEDNKIQAFKRFVIGPDDIKQGSAELEAIIVPEGSIVNGGTKVEISLTDAKWLDLENDKTLRDKLFNGLKSNNQNPQWFNVVTTLMADGGGISIDDNREVLTFYLAKTPSYDIVEDQIITLEIPPEVIGAVNPIYATGTMTIKPTIKATIGGDVVSRAIRQEDIEKGGVKIVINLHDGNWLGDIDKDTLIGGFKGGTNWDIIAGKLETDGSLERNSSKEVTLILPAVEGVDFDGGREDISLTIAKELISGATLDIVASPTFTIYPNVLKVGASAVGGSDTVELFPPDYRVVNDKVSTWQIKVSNGSLKEIVENDDLVITGLPRGLTADVSNVNGNIIEIQVTGTASTTLAADATVKIKVKGSAVTEPNSVDSDDISLQIIRGQSMMGELKEVKVDVEGKALKYELGSWLDTDDFEFSLDSSNGINGENWLPTTGGNTRNIDFRAGKVYVRSKENPREFWLVATLSHPKAPVGISIGEVDYTDGMKVQLAGLDNGVSYDISTDGGNNWSSLSLGDLIELEPEADLRVRLGATKDSLHSLATAKLNGLDLRDVEIDVAAGLLKETNSSIQYSVNSTDGIDGNWATAKNGETQVSFISGNQVWIRQQNSTVNKRDMGKILSMAEPDTTDISFNILDEKMVNTSEQKLEYRITGGNWAPLENESEVENVKFKAGLLEIRTRGDKEKLPSKPNTLDIIPAPIDPPEIKGNDDQKTIQYLDEDGIWKNIDDKLEYRIGANSTEWKSGSDFNDDSNKNDTIIIYVRKKAEEKLLPSNEKPISFTKNLTFENIRFDIANKLILGTTQNMEYRIGSKDEDDGIWLTAGKDKTPIEPFEGMYIWLREKNKASTEMSYITSLERQEKPDLTDVTYNIEAGIIDNDTDYNLQYRISNDSWKNIDAKTKIYGITFKAGRLEFRQRATDSKLESHPEQKAIISASASAPDVEIDDVKNKVESISNYDTDRSEIEYRINPGTNSPWLSGELLDTEDLSGEKNVEIRIKATKDTLPSQFAELKFTANLELDHINLSTHVHPFVLNGTTNQMEYSIIRHDGNGNELPPHSWKVADNGNTVLADWLNTSNLSRIEIRDKNQHDNKIEIVYN
ncbi:MAG: hypothetical protein WCZ27_00730 [Tissierellaceae bacterium]